ncbi:MAG: hypothetical protein LBO73_01705 [Holosporaceae bacterium]|jgi:hypothetical protein|nr:hypothetical protein [Holosporaceae bacterium]
MFGTVEDFNWNSEKDAENVPMLVFVQNFAAAFSYPHHHHHWLSSQL